VTGLSFPWYYSGGGLRLTVAGEEYHLSFVLPNGAQPPAAPAASGREAKELAKVAVAAQEGGAGRRAGREWRRLLEGRTAS
jgi:hypothetical protein